MFVAHAIGGVLKTEPDEHSRRAAWVRLPELLHYRLRSDEVRRHFEHVAGGGFVAPLGLLSAEGAPYAPSLRPDRA